jgi:uncharacterized membrane protein (UPF0136 family)
VSRSRTAGLVILALLGLLDIVGLVGFFVSNAPPAWVLLTGGGLGVLTLIGAWLAFAGRSGGLATAITTRAISAILAVGAFVDKTAPDWSKVVVAIAIALTVLGIALTAAGKRPATARTAT